MGRSYSKSTTMKISFYSKHRITTHGTTQLRCLQPAEILSGLGYNVRVNTLYLSKPRKGELIILHRAKLDKHTKLFILYARSLGCTIWYDLDDLLFSKDAERYLNHIGNKRKDFSSREYLDCIGLCDKVIVSTDYLKSQLADIHKNVVVVRNFLSEKFLLTAEQVYNQRQSTEYKQFTLGYLSGSKSHNKDFAEITPALLQILGKYSNAKLIIVGPLELDKRFEPYKDQIDHRAFIPYADLPKVYTEIDLNLVPLEKEEAFCQAKSELKYIEAAACGVASIASATPPYAYAIEHGVNGFLIHDNEWFEVIDALHDNPSMLKESAEAARKHCLLHYTSAAAAGSWKDLLASYDPVRPLDTSFRKNLAFRLDRLRWKRIIKRKMKDLRTS